MLKNYKNLDDKTNLFENMLDSSLEESLFNNSKMSDLAHF
jgi:hypothetical protein